MIFTFDKLIFFMSETVDTLIEEKQETTTQINPFSNDNWKGEPTESAPLAELPIEENKEEVKDVLPSDTEKTTTPNTPVATTKEQKPNPNITEPVKFANEESEKVYNLLKEGKKDEVLSILNEQKKLSEVDKLSPSGIIKLNLQYQNKELTQSEINDLFNDSYELPEKPEQELSETNEEFEERTVKYNKELKKIENRISRDSKPAVIELKKLSKDIVLPDIPKIELQSLEPTQEELDTQKQNVEKFLKSVDEGLANFNGYNATFKDEEVEIPVAYKLTKEEKAELQPLIALSNLDAPSFLKNIGWLDSDGNINTAKLAEDLPFIMDKNKVLGKMVLETGNKRHQASVKSIRNIDYSGSKPSGGDMGKNPEEIQKEFATHFFQNA